MAGEDRWFNGRLPPAPPEGGGDNNGVFGDPNIPLSGFSHPVSGFQSSGSGFSSTFSGQTNNFGSYSGLPNSFSTFSGDTSHGVAFKRIKLADSNYQPTGHHPVFQVPQLIDSGFFLSGFLVESFLHVYAWWFSVLSPFFSSSSALFVAAFSGFLNYYFFNFPGN